MDLLLALDYAFFSLTDDKEHVVNKKEFINQINSLYSLAWSLTASVSSLLDQVGIPAHRVFSENSIEHFFFFLNNPPKSNEKVTLINGDVSVYIKELSLINTKLIMSIDDVVTQSLLVDSQEKSRKKTLFSFFKTNKWSDCANVRFNKVICPVYEATLCKTNFNFK